MRSSKRSLPVVALVALVLAVGGCGEGGAESTGASAGASSSTVPSSASVSHAPSTAERDDTATTGPECTVGTIPEGTPVPTGCDRLYSPFLAPGASCVEGQTADCVDPDGDGSFTFVVDGGRCLVERKEPERCRDDDGDGRLDQPLLG